MLAKAAQRAWMSLSEVAVFEQGFSEFIKDRGSSQEEKNCSKELNMLREWQGGQQTKPPGAERRM